MSDQVNWFVIPSDNSVTSILSNNEPSYDLFNETVFQRLVYGEREYGINLVWEDPEPATPSIRFLAASGAPSAILYGERVAINVRGGGYLRYGEREYGINLKWSDEPVYEWRLLGNPSLVNTPVDIANPVGLYNTVANDYVFYDPRRYGINLKWLRDKGKFNSKPWYESVADALTGILDELGNFVFEIVNRAFGVVDFVLTFFGIMLPKRVRVRIVILRGADGRAIIADGRLPQRDLAAQKQELDDAIAVIKKCFREQLNTRVRAAGGVLVETLPFPAPQAALHVRCGTGAWREDFQEAGKYFRYNAATNRSQALLGYGAPITIFVVDDVEDKVGCSISLLSDYVVVDRVGMQSTKGAPEPRPTTPMHELGHACGLWHSWPALLHTGNLMKSGTPRGIILELYQRAIMRNSRHITFL
ncbi:hypothetical protein [Herbidospora mongoliensis]|uniref:hypothetical protein n=1 Tax=Herbidospora mongoliensis TaxID=688067 RepID=UPI000ACCBFB3|nr:hypothetical protein [Herbidospora mongoliensis]